ncbi:hypothetical protein DPSP01_002538 [Paraphaeosphaeria sporulosa]|uniref:CFEM domain-containing protein n=1 Tax=Paraphaeosphaeria sporulosa TaxID=1460663 RepID=A0A177CW16_9PLEO|nr:CFEM domain-containing protein [Paraphaeosphaeria sporulosa]OAG11426.1 CFEM domain-containing protein [Paraphaeosphaeria sporulosa]
MRAPIAILTLLLLSLPFSIAQGTLTEAIEQLPACALKCLVSAISESPCQLTDQTCICTNQKLQLDVEVCVLQACSKKEALTTKNITSTSCGAPIRDSSALYCTISTTLAVLSAALVLLRLGYKMFITSMELGLDDCFVFITLLAGTPSSAINVLGLAANGLGKDVWTLRFNQITSFSKYFYIMEIMYFAQITLLKLSLLFFYLRVFPGKPVRRVIWATVIFNSLFGAVFVTVAIFQCRPISHYWNEWHGETPGTCININALGWSNAAISIALDFWMLAIPISQLLDLQLAWKKKVGVALMFCVGTFVTVVSILRLHSLVHFAKSINPTWDYWAVSNWSTVEINVGIMCVCMPSLRIILVRFFPKVLGTMRSNTGGYARYGSSSRIERVKIGNSNASTGHDKGMEDDVEMIIREAPSVDDSRSDVYKSRVYR